MSFPQIIRSSLPPNTIVPKDEDLFIEYLNRLYEDIAFTVNQKDDTFYPFPISSTAADIANVPNFGAFIISISGTDSTLPTLTAALCKSDAGAAGTVVSLNSQAGTGVWAGINLTITSTATNFQVAHNLAGVTANFNIRVIGTQ